MEKVICLLWHPDGADKDAWHADLRARLPGALAGAGASGIRLNLDDAAVAPAAGLRQQRAGHRQHDAAVQFWLPSANGLFRSAVDAALDSVARSWCGWVVCESTIIANTRHPAQPGARTEGWSQMAFLTLPARLSHGEWLADWQDRHTKVAVETQSNFEYVQNLVVRPLPGRAAANAPPYVAIVEECFPAAAMTDPTVFFGGAESFEANLATMMDSVGRFIDAGTIDVIPTSQYMA